MTDVGEIAGAFKEGFHLFDGILSRADRDALKKELDENKTRIQNSFASGDLDEQYRVYYKLFTDVGHPPTPGGSLGDAERQFRHEALFVAAELKYAQGIIARLVSEIGKLMAK